MTGPCAIEASAPVSGEQVLAIAEQLSDRLEVDSVVLALVGRRGHLPPTSMRVSHLPADTRPLELVVTQLQGIPGRCVMLLRVADGGYEVATAGWDTRTPWEVLVPAEEPPTPVSSGEAAPAPADGPAPSP
ncbi:MAG: hypothetical protein H6738_23560 [Alphaproteobacteria bacterium]|nr:hypothetical protein [Alphaproteobacteria bacterium]MCB9699784.1 hypothetical protein [Alphaproteobacteria bacterium]